MPSKVCVGIMTYNQASYVRQALDSVLGQQTNFPFEILVHDDCSTDGTQQVLAEYATRHPTRIRTILQSENQLSQGRRILTILLDEMRGEYFALLDGDDFWNSSRKLQAQADFLDTNPGCVLCQTKTAYFNESKNRVEKIFPPIHRRRVRCDIGDLAAGNFIQTSAAMFRADAVPVIPPVFQDLPFGDYAFFALLAQNGWIGLIDEEMVTYRIHDSNFWTNRGLAARSAATHEVIQFLAAHLRPEFQKPWIKAANSFPNTPVLGRLVRLLRRLGLQR